MNEIFSFLNFILNIWFNNKKLEKEKKIFKNLKELLEQNSDVKNDNIFV